MARRGIVRLMNQTDDEFKAITRVLETLAAVPARALQFIREAEDHKGTLLVTWIVLPSDDCQRVVERAWATIGEETHVEHLCGKWSRSVFLQQDGQRSQDKEFLQ